jgi:hypothetical protein
MMNFLTLVAHQTADFKKSFFPVAHEYNPFASAFPLQTFAAAYWTDDHVFRPDDVKPFLRVKY